VISATDTDSPTKLDDFLRQLVPAQGAPSYVLLMRLLAKQPDLQLSEDHLVQGTDRLLVPRSSDRRRRNFARPPRATWTVTDIETRTKELAKRAPTSFPLV
jgi:hypothetical protein